MNSTLRERVTQEMMDAITKGLPPWRRPWSGSEVAGLPCNFASKRRYTGINPLILNYSSLIKGFDSKFWGTAKSWQSKLGVEVKPDQNPTLVLLFAFVPKKDGKKPITNSKGEHVLFPLLREFAVFNAEQMEVPSMGSLMALPIRKLRSIAKSHSVEVPRGSSIAEAATIVRTAIEQKLDRYIGSDAVQNTDPDFVPAEEFIAQTEAPIRYGGSRAVCSGNLIRVPHRHTFDSINDFYETTFHEMVHWGEHTVGKDPNRKGSYGFGELVAEIGACFLMLELNVPMSAAMMLQSQSYVKAWLNDMQGDSKYIFDAARQASKVVDHLLTLAAAKRRAA